MIDDALTQAHMHISLRLAKGAFPHRWVDAEQTLATQPAVASLSSLHLFDSLVYLGPNKALAAQSANACVLNQILRSILEYSTIILRPPLLNQRVLLTFRHHGSGMEKDLRETKILDVFQTNSVMVAGMTRHVALSSRTAMLSLC